MTKHNCAFFKGALFCLYMCLGIFCLQVLMPIAAVSQSGQSTRTDTSETQLREVTISGQKLYKRQTSATPLQILSGTDLQRLNSLSVADAVRFFSGVQLKDYGGVGGLKTINVRSMGTNHTAVFYDGVQLGNAQNGQVDLGKYSMDNIQEIELYSGQQSSIFQSAKSFASASALYLKTKQPAFEAGKNDHYQASIKAGSFGLVNPSLLWQHKISNSLSSSISTEYKKAHGRYPFRYTNGVYDTTAVRNNGDMESIRLEAGVYGTFKDSSSLSTKIYVYNDAQGLPGAIVSNKFNYTQRLWNRNFFLQSSYQKDFKRYSLQATLKYANDEQRYLDPEFVSSNGLLNNHFKQQELYLSVANKYSINQIWTVALSTDVQQNTLTANLDFFPYPTRNTFLGVIATQLQFKRLDIQANVLATVLEDRVKQYYAAGVQQKLTPALLISWQPFAGQPFNLRSFYKSVFRMPTFNDLYYTFIGNTKLKPELARQYDLGFTYSLSFDRSLLKQVSIQADAYFNQVKDKIVAVPGANLFRWSMQNLDEVEIKGLDVNVQSTWLGGKDLNFSAGLNYAYQQALDVTPGSYSYERQIPYIPLHSGTFMAAADYKRLSVNYSYIYTGARYNQKANTLYNYVEPWYTHDMALHYKTNVMKHSTKSTIKLGAEVSNLFNQHYDVVANFPMPGRNYRFTLTYNL